MTTSITRSPTIGYETHINRDVEPNIKTTYLTFKEKGKPKMSIYHSMEKIPPAVKFCSKQNFLNLWSQIPGRRRSAADQLKATDHTIKRSASAGPNFKPPRHSPLETSPLVKSPEKEKY